MNKQKCGEVEDIGVKVSMYTFCLPVCSFSLIVLIRMFADIFSFCHDSLFLFQVYVLPPKKMEFIPSVVEAQVGTSLSLPLAVACCIYKGTVKFKVENQMLFL